jgi:transposase
VIRKPAKRLTNRQVASMIKGFSTGKTLKALAKRYKVSESTVLRWRTKWMNGYVTLNDTGTNIETWGRPGLASAQTF